MTRVVLVRHGRAAAGWDADPDPPLDDLGRAQAALVAEYLGGGPACAVVSSPMLRCRQTAAPLALAWGATVPIVPEVSEIPSPQGVVMADRVGWLRAAMAGEWSTLGLRYEQYRDSVVQWVRERPADTVVVSHFVAINTVIGAATGDDRLVIASLDNCSCTVVDVVDGELRLVSTGREATTLIR